MSKMKKKVVNPNQAQNVICPYCGATAVLKKNKDMYGENCRNPEGFIYICKNFEKDCDALVTTHDGTKIPKGFMANASTRRKRIEAHKYMNDVINKKIFTKKDLYKYLSIKIPFCEKDFHVADSNEYQCDQAIKVLKTLLFQKKAVQTI